MFWQFYRSDISGRRIHYAIRRDGVRALPCRDHDGFCATRPWRAWGRRSAAMWVFISLLQRYETALQQADCHVCFARLLWLWIKCAEHTNMRFAFFLQFFFETSLAVIHTQPATPHIHVHLHAVIHTQPAAPLIHVHLHAAIHTQPAAPHIHVYLHAKRLLFLLWSLFWVSSKIGTFQ